MDAHLQRKLKPADALLFEAKLLLHDDLNHNVSAQQHVYSLVQQYGRKQLRQEIEAVHQQLFNQPEHMSFRQKIASIFLNR
jgi:hypothetical protein